MDYGKDYSRYYPEGVWEKMLAQVRVICEQYGIVTEPEYILRGGMDEMFDEEGNLLQETFEKEMEYGRRWAFGDREKESVWASHIGD